MRKRNIRFSNANFGQLQHHNLLLNLCIWSLGFFVCRSCAAQDVDAYTFTNVNFAFEAFSPYGMARFFAFSDRDWNISENCLRHIYKYLEGLRSNSFWAIKLFDANGYYGGGVFGGVQMRIHNPNFCRLLQREHEYIKNLYPVMTSSFWSENFDTVLPFDVAVVVGKYLYVLVDGKVFTIQQQMCLPSNCNNDDLKEMLDVSKFERSSVIIKNQLYLSHRLLTSTHNVFDDANFFALIFLIFTSVFIYVLAYLIRCYLMLWNYQQQRIMMLNSVSKINAAPHERNRNFRDFLQSGNFSMDFRPFSLFSDNLANGWIATNSTKSVNFVVDETNGKLSAEPIVRAKQQVEIVEQTFWQQMEEFLYELSLPQVIKNLLQTNDATKLNTNGFYFLITVLLIYAKLMAQLDFIANNRQLNPDGQLSQRFLVRQASYIFDLYFFVSGADLGYIFFQTSPSDKFCVFKHTLHFFQLIVKKLFSLTASNIFSVFAANLLDNYLQQNVAIEIPSFDYRNCHGNELSKIFYMDPFLSINDRCMPWCWFISLEMQFYVFACLILLLAEVNPRFAIVIGSCLFLVSFLAATLWEFGQTTSKTHSNVNELELMQFNLIFDNICLRIGPYAIGICLGFVLHRNDFNSNFDRLLMICGWIGCLLIFGLFYFGIEMVLKSVNKMLRALLVTLTHTMWSVVLFWTLFTGLTGNFQILSRLTFISSRHMFKKLSTICLLIAPIVIRIFVLTADVPIYTSNGQILLLTLGVLLPIYGTAFLLYMLFDGLIEAFIFVAFKIIHNLVPKSNIKTESNF